MTQRKKSHEMLCALDAVNSCVRSQTDINPTTHTAPAYNTVGRAVKYFESPVSSVYLAKLGQYFVEISCTAEAVNRPTVWRHLDAVIADFRLRWRHLEDFRRPRVSLVWDGRVWRHWKPHTESACEDGECQRVDPAWYWIDPGGVMEVKNQDSGDNGQCRHRHCQRHKHAYSAANTHYFYLGSQSGIFG